MTHDDGLPRRSSYLRGAERLEADRKWREENREAIEAYNRIIKEDGYVFSDGVRTF
jgi:post-segregation antitoxin (ccd killing protein)